MVVRVAAQKKLNQNEPGKKTSELPKNKSQEKKKKAKKKNKNYWPSKLTPGEQLHPIHEIPERDFLDGALEDAGSLKPPT